MAKTENRSGQDSNIRISQSTEKSLDLLKELAKTKWNIESPSRKWLIDFAVRKLIEILEED
ncbi:hypothetical protein [Mesoplasma whartonense]|uniref:hypothetical protein n=1 Tax=Mesoplasma whartonense TaxID=2878854 RepID=UPI002022A91F|nr:MULTISPECIES: hypothetical protein [unclassified Mesoplasma]MCL8212965.1 hypothetical protein [Mesoplasma sp. JKS002661]MCL8216164.1 hypothetical protein [Mesoplasma sp. JKS002657]